MATRDNIVAAIKMKAGGNYKIWRIGLTHDLADRKKYWGETEKQNIGYWTAWPADSLIDAQAIEAYFIKMGMKGGAGGDLSPKKAVYIYVF